MFQNHLVYSLAWHLSARQCFLFVRLLDKQNHLIEVVQKIDSRLQSFDARMAALERAFEELKSTIESEKPVGFVKDVAASDVCPDVDSEEFASKLQSCMFAAVDLRVTDPEEKERQRARIRHGSPGPSRPAAPPGKFSVS